MAMCCTIPDFRGDAAVSLRHHPPPKKGKTKVRLMLVATLYARATVGPVFFWRPQQDGARSPGRRTYHTPPPVTAARAASPSFPPPGGGVFVTDPLALFGAGRKVTCLVPPGDVPRSPPLPPLVCAPLSSAVLLLPLA
jgi:hypothetical protein